MTPDLLDTRLSQLQRRHRLQGGLDVAYRWWTAGLVGLAVLVIVQRVAAPGWGMLLWPGLAAVVLAPLCQLGVIWRQHRRSRNALAAELDVLTQTQGLTMAMGETPVAERDPDWLARLRLPLERLELPRLDHRKATLTLLAVISLAVVTLVPERTSRNDPGVIPWDPVFEPALATLEQIHEDGLLNPEETEEFQRRLTALTEAAQKDGMSQGQWEALERLQVQMEAKRSEAVEALAATLMQAEQQKDSKVNPQQQAQELEKRLKELAKRHPGVMQALAQMAQGLPKQGNLDPQNQLPMLKPGALAQKLQKIDKEALKRLAEKLDKKMKEGKCQGLMAALQRKGFGLDRGPGHQSLELTQKKSDVDPQKMGGLPPGAVVNPDGSITLGQSRRDADIDDATAQDLVRAQARSFGADAADARRSRVAPRHRSAVAAYFGQDSKENTAHSEALPPTETIPPASTEDESPLP